MTFVLFFAVQTASPSQATRVEKIDALMSAYHAYHQFNGSILVAANGKVIYKKGFGSADVDRGIVNGPTTRFPLASLTKQFTAALVLKLVAKGELSLDDTVSDHLPYYREDSGKRITIHHLLSHSSGIPSYGRDKSFMRQGAKKPVDVAAFVQARCSDDLAFAPGTRAQYSNSGYYLLGAIIEAVTGQSYGDAVQNHFFTPLHMKDSGYGFASSDGGRLAIGYRQVGETLAPANTLDASVAFSAGGLYASVEDLFTWNRALFARDLLPKELLVKMMSPVVGRFGYGVKLGSLQLPNHGAMRFAAHGGGIFGFSHHLIHFTDDDHMIAILCNAGERPQLAEQNILRILHDLPYEKPRPTVADAVMSLIRDGKTEEALTRARALSEEGYVLDEGEFDRMGGALRDDGKLTFAIALYTTSTKLFPRSGRAFEGLGKSYLMAQNMTAATQAFKQAFQLDPQLDDTKRVLDMMGIDLTTPSLSEPSPSREVLARFVGDYQMSPQRILRIYLEDGLLMARPSGQRSVQLQPESETRFQVKGAPAKIEFRLDDQGKVIGVTLSQRGREMTGKRLE